MHRLWQMLQLMQIWRNIFKLMNSVIIRRMASLLFFAFLSANVFSQINVRYYGAKKSFYHHGDTIHVAVVMRLNPKSCLDGMRKTYIYFSGCEDIRRAQWKKLPKNLFYKEMTVRVADNAKSKAKMTITRSTDKDSYFRQETFNIK
jgi:hypothetical protein